MLGFDADGQWGAYFRRVPVIHGKVYDNHVFLFDFWKAIDRVKNRIVYENGIIRLIEPTDISQMWVSGKTIDAHYDLKCSEAYSEKGKKIVKGAISLRVKKDEKGEAVKDEEGKVVKEIHILPIMHELKPDASIQQDIQHGDTVKKMLAPKKDEHGWIFWCIIFGLGMLPIILLLYYLFGR